MNIIAFDNDSKVRVTSTNSIFLAPLAFTFDWRKRVLVFWTTLCLHRRVQP
jgi:hypothetical protein